jgi:predicted metal-dependent peptidase
MQIKNREARNKVIRARTSLLISNGFFGFLVMHLNLIEDYTIDTAAVDGISIYYNPDFMVQLTDRECEFVMAHEVMHCCFKHFSRRGNRDPQAWNCAGDFVINLDLRDSGFQLIKDKVMKGFKRPFNVLIDDKYKGMSTEEIYDSFPKVYMDSIKLLGPDPGGCGGVRDTPGGTAKRDQQAQNWETQVRIAVNTARQNNAGNLPPSLQRLIDDLNKPKISWRDKTRNFIDASLSKEPSWARINRRSAATGMLLPGLVSDRLSKLVFFPDISGSVNIKMLREFLSEVAGALDENVADQLVVAYADTAVRHVDHFYPGDIVKAKTFDGGGTDFADSFRWLRENEPDASCVIYLTDLEVHNFGEDPGVPVLWAVSNSHERYEALAAKVPFGMPIFLSTSMG